MACASECFKQLVPRNHQTETTRPLRILGIHHTDVWPRTTVQLNFYDPMKQPHPIMWRRAVTDRPHAKEMQDQEHVKADGREPVVEGDQTSE